MPSRNTVPHFIAVMVSLALALSLCPQALASVDVSHLVGKAREFHDRTIGAVESGSTAYIDVSDMGISADDLLDVEILSEEMFTDEWSNAMLSNGMYSRTVEDGIVKSVRPRWYRTTDVSEIAARQRVMESLAKYAASFVRGDARAACRSYGTVRFKATKRAVKELKRRSKLKGKVRLYEFRAYLDRDCFDRVAKKSSKKRRSSAVVRKTSKVWTRFRVTVGKKRSKWSKPVKVKLKRTDVWGDRKLREHELSVAACRHLARRCAYESSYNGSDIDGNGAYGALYGGRTRCLGYTRAYQAIADELGLESEIVIGVVPGYGGELDGAHAWNRVKVGGSWRWVDATWFDGMGSDYYADVPYGDKEFLSEHDAWKMLW